MQATAQVFGAPISTFDRDTILNQIHPEVQTRKLLLLGHSQGTMYANEIHGYMLQHGQPREAVGVYNIASPAGYVAGGGKHLNAENDSLLDFVEGKGISVLERNIFLLRPAEGDVASLWPGHGISRAYLASNPERIVGELQESLGKLEPVYASETGECFTPPGRSAAYKAKQLFYGVADPIVSGGVALAKLTKNVAVGTYTALASVGDALTPEPRTQNLAGSHTIVQKMFGSSVSEQDLIDFGLVEAPAQQPAAAPAPIDPELDQAISDTIANLPKLPYKPPIEEPLIPAPPPVGGGGGISPGFGGGAPAPSPQTATPAETPVPEEEEPAAPTPEPEPIPEPEPEPTPEPDTTPPVLTIISGPENEEEIPYGTFPIFEFSATDPSGVHFVCAVDIGIYPPCTSPFQVQELLSPGIHGVVVGVQDDYGNGTGHAFRFRVVE